MIRDHRIGLLYYVLMVGIALYIIVWQLFRDCGYLTMQAPINSARLTLKEPTNLTAAKDLAYCCSAASVSECEGGTQFCSYLDGGSASVPMSGRLLVGTQVDWRNVTYNEDCFSAALGYPYGADSCSSVTSDTSIMAQTFVADIERFTVLIEHTLMKPDGSLTLGSTAMNGLLEISLLPDQTEYTELQNSLCRDRNGIYPLEFPASSGKRTDTAPCYVKAMQSHDGVGGLDIFEVGELLQAGNMSLDDINEGYYPFTDNFRNTGRTVEIVVQYTNSRPWSGTIQPYYTYQVRPVYGGHAVEDMPLSAQVYPNRTYKHVHGISLNVVAGGQIADRFDFMTALIQLSASASLLAIATIVMNVLITYLVQMRTYYNDLMFEVGPDFDDVTELDAWEDAEVERELVRMDLPRGGTRARKILRILQERADRVEDSQRALAASARASNQPSARESFVFHSQQGTSPHSVESSRDVRQRGNGSHSSRALQLDGASSA